MTNGLGAKSQIFGSVAPQGSKIPLLYKMRNEIL